MFYVYVLYRPWDGTPCYVGKGKGKRVHVHKSLGAKHPNTHLARIYAKAGGDLPYRIVFETPDEKEAFAKERALIAHYGRADLGLGGLCNFTNGGEGPSGQTRSDATRARLAEAMRAIMANQSPELKAKRSAAASLAHTGKVIPEEMRKTISEALKGRKVPSDVLERRADTQRRNAAELDFEERRRMAKAASEARIGTFHTEDTKRTISAKNAGRILSPQTRERMREAVRLRLEASTSEQRRAQAANAAALKRGVPRSAETKAKISESWKRRMEIRRLERENGPKHA